VALHDTVVVPTLNWEPDSGVQLIDTAPVPPLDTGFGNLTRAFPLLPEAATGATWGHDSVKEGC
jgi:hypothetical protein